MAKVDLELALVKAQGRSPLTPDELSELLNVDLGQLLTAHNMDLYQAEQVLMWCKHESLRHSKQLISFPPRGEEKEGLAEKLKESRTGEVVRKELHRTLKTEGYATLGLAQNMVDKLERLEGEADFAAIIGALGTHLVGLGFEDDEIPDFMDANALAKLDLRTLQELEGVLQDKGDLWF